MKLLGNKRSLSDKIRTKGLQAKTYIRLEALSEILILLQGPITKPSEKESLLTAPMPNTGSPWIDVPRYAKEMLKCPTRNMANSSLDNADQ